MEFRPVLVPHLLWRIPHLLSHQLDALLPQVLIQELLDQAPGGEALGRGNLVEAIAH